MLFEIIWEDGQLQMSLWPEFVLIFLVPLFLILEIAFIKIGLKLAKAQTRKGFKWVILSVLIQVGLFAFVAMPFVMLGFMGMMGEMSAMAPLIILLVLFAMFLDICVINSLHKIGIKRAIGVFIFFLIPIIIVGSVAGVMIGSAYSQPQSSLPLF